MIDTLLLGCIQGISPELRSHGNGYTACDL